MAGARDAGSFTRRVAPAPAPRTGATHRTGRCSSLPCRGRGVSPAHQTCVERAVNKQDESRKPKASLHCREEDAAFRKHGWGAEGGKGQPRRHCPPDRTRHVCSRPGALALAVPSLGGSLSPFVKYWLKCHLLRAAFPDRPTQKSICPPAPRAAALRTPIFPYLLVSTFMCQVHRPASPLECKLRHGSAGSVEHSARTSGGAREYLQIAGSCRLPSSVLAEETTVLSPEPHPFLPAVTHVLSIISFSLPPIQQLASFELCNHSHTALGPRICRGLFSTFYVVHVSLAQPYQAEIAIGFYTRRNRGTDKAKHLSRASQLRGDTSI